jgi:hypothetical protein
MSKPVSDRALSTPDIPASRAKVTLCASTVANAGAALCFGKLLDTSVWRDWNQLVPEVTIRSQPVGDEWETPLVSRNPSTARDKPSSPKDQPNPRIGDIAEVGVREELSVEASSPRKSNPPLGSRRDTNSHLALHEPLESQRNPAARLRHLSISTLGGEPSTRLRLGTSMTFHVILNPSKPRNHRNAELIVSELLRPGDQPPGQRPAYRIMWESDTSLTFPHSLPKWLLFCQRVTEVRPVTRGDGKEDCEIMTWECQRGFLARFVKRYYRERLQRMFEQNVHGLQEYCEAMGGAVDRRDFSISAGM